MAQMVLSRESESALQDKLRKFYVIGNLSFNEEIELNSTMGYLISLLTEMTPYLGHPLNQFLRSELIRYKDALSPLRRKYRCVNEFIILVNKSYSLCEDPAFQTIV
jgi:hypothetical protein